MKFRKFLKPFWHQARSAEVNITAPTTPVEPVSEPAPVASEPVVPAPEAPTVAHLLQQRLPFKRS